MTLEEAHPFREFVNPCNGMKGGFVPKGTRIVVFGTHPPKSEWLEKGEGFFYYSSPRNHFYVRIDNIFSHVPGYIGLKKTKSRNYSETFIENRMRKEAFFRSHGIGFMDVFSKVMRRKEGSTRDEDLVKVETVMENGSFDALVKMERIEKVCCTYLLAYNLLQEYLYSNKDYDVSVVGDDRAANQRKLIVQAYGKGFEVVLLYPATRSFHKGEVKDAQYKKYLFG